MAGDSGTGWKDLGWRIGKAVVISGLLMVLYLLGVSGISPQYPTGGRDLAAASVTHWKGLAGVRQATLTIADGGTIAPTGLYQPVTAAGAVGCTMSGTGAVDGQLCVLMNVGANNIVITDTGTTMLTGNLTLGQYDTVFLVFDGTNWLQLGTANN